MLGEEIAKVLLGHTTFRDRFRPADLYLSTWGSISPGYRRGEYERAGTTALCL